MNKKIITKLTSGALLFTMLTYTLPVFAYTKDETVYTKIDVNGKNYSTIVNSHIKNRNKERIINDLSDLINVKNVNGDEEFSQSGNSLIWKADGADIYYQGESNKSLPIECSLKYELDGKAISPEELAGKSGKVKITIEYSNKDAHLVNINGKDEILYTPFTIVLGTILDNTNFRNIEVSTGRVIDDGTKTFVIGIAFPGLKESLNLADDKIDIPNKVEITADSENFQTTTMASFVTPKIIEESDLSILNDLDDMYSNVNTLESSGKQLEDGANALKNGTDTFLEKSKEFNNAMKQVSSGTNAALEGYISLDDGIRVLNDSTFELVDGAKSLSDGANSINSALGEVNTNFKTIANGTKGLSEGLTSAVSDVNKLLGNNSTTPPTSIEEDLSKLTDATKENITKVITSSNTSLGTEKTKLNAQLSALNVQIEKIKTINPDWETNPDVKSQLLSLTTSCEIIKNSIASIDTSMSANLEFGTNLGTTLQNTANSIKNKLSAYQALLTKLPEMVQKLTYASNVAEQLSSGTTKLQAGINTLTISSKDLANGANSLYSGCITFSDGTKTLYDGSNEMKSGLKNLSAGTNELSVANDMLTDGASSLSNGAGTLANGMKQFNVEGIKKICSLINGDVKRSN